MSVSQTKKAGNLFCGSVRHYEWLGTDVLVMFWFFPFLQGRDLDYRQYFALMTISIAGIVSFLSIFLYLFLSSLRSSHHFSQVNFWFSELSLYLGYIALTVVVTSFSIFDFVSVYVTLPVASGLMLWRFWQWCRNCYAGSSGQQGEGWVKRVVRTVTVVEMNHTVMFYVLLIVSGLVGVVFPPVSAGLCLCYYNTDMGIVFGDTSLSTRLTRYLTMPESCPPGPPCHVYLTLPEDSSHFVFLNAHASPHYDSLKVHYGLQSDSMNSTLYMTLFPVEGFEPHADRHVFAALLSNLTSNTRYFVQIEYQPGLFSQLYWFRTLPYGNETSLRFAAGGDIGNSPFAYTISTRAGELNPSIGFVGGDLAYDNNFRACARTWDLLLTQWKLLSTDPTQLVPLVFSLGNHDVGLESLSGKSLPNDGNAPLYFVFFPQHFPRDNQGNIVHAVPEITQRLSYFKHEFGLCSFYTLDSGYIANYTGPQLAWLKSTLPTDTSVYKFAQYHLPAYPSIPLDPDENFPSGETLKYWVPVFDEFAFTVIFENHVHSFKRTVPLTCSLETASGVIYVGDGQWGAGSQTTPNPGFDTDPEIFMKEGLKFHVWVVEVSSEDAEFTAIGLNPGDVVDSFTLTRT